MSLTFPYCIGFYCKWYSMGIMYQMMQLVLDLDIFLEDCDVENNLSFLLMFTIISKYTKDSVPYEIYEQYAINII